MKLGCNRFYIIVLFCLLLCLPGELFSQQNIVQRELSGYGLVEFVEGEVIVRYRDGITTLQRANLQTRVPVRAITQFRHTPALHLVLDDMSVEEALSTLSGRPDVEYAEPNFVRRRIDPVKTADFSRSRMLLEEGEGVTPDDTFYDAMWALFNEGQTLPNTNISGTPGADIKAYLAWELTTGSEDVIVAILDSGIDYNHEDLNTNLFTDEDGNVGIDCSPATLSANDGECGVDPMDRDGHGTHVAGTIGAVGDNGVGVTGVNWNVRLMAVKVFNDNGFTTSVAIVKGLDYAVENGAVVSNHSYGGSGFSEFEFQAFERARNNGHLAVAAAGNRAENNDNEKTRLYPASFDLDNMISVAATTFDDELAWFSNYGVNSVHIAAPGEVIASTVPDNGYAYFSGTSMAVPHVAGVAALIKALHPEAEYSEIRDRILHRADQLESLDGLIMESRRLNALTALLDDDGTAPAQITDLRETESGQFFTEIEWTAVGYSGNTGFAKSYEVRFSQSPITENNFEQAELAGRPVIPLNAGEIQKLSLRNLEPATTYYVAVKAEGFFENKSELSNVMQFATDNSPLASTGFEGYQTTLSTGDTDEFSFTISNNGQGVLNLQSPGRLIPRSLADINHQPFTYIHANSYKDMGDAFEWTDISGSGNAINFGNPVDGVESVELPFTFPFYGEEKDELFVSVNGFLSFSPVTDLTGSALNQKLPSGAEPNDLIAVHWSNFDLRQSGTVYTYYDIEQERYIIQWDRLNPYPGELFENQFHTFQAILYKGGAIKMQYLELDPSTRFLSVGLENESGSDGEQFAFNQLLIEEGMALLFLPTQPEWLEVSQSSFSIPAGESVELEVTVNATALLAGDYYSEIYFIDNDMNGTPVRVPVQLTVEGETTLVRFIHNSLDQQLVRFDLFLNGRLFRHNLIFNRTTDLIEVPAGLELTASIVTESSDSRDDPIAQNLVQFDANKEITAVMTGQSGGTGNREFRFYTYEIEPQEVEADELRLIVFNGVTDAERIGLFGYLPNDLPPIHILDQLAFGNFREVRIPVTSNMELDVIEGHDLLDSFQFNVTNLAGQSLLLAAAGSGNQQGEPDIAVMSYSNSSSGNQLQKRTNPDHKARHIPEQLELRQNYPNPFNPNTNILFRLPQTEQVRIVVYDILGRPVQTVVDQQYQAGIHTVTFDGSRLASGVYFYRIQAGNENLTRKMMLVK